MKQVNRTCPFFYFLFMENKKNVIQLMSQRKALPPDELRNTKLYVCVFQKGGGDPVAQLLK